MWQCVRPENNNIKIRGANENKSENLDVDIREMNLLFSASCPDREKSSLAFDTI